MDVKGKAILDRLITQLAVLEEQGLGHSLFFLRLQSNAFPDVGSVGLKKKKKLKKKSQEVS